MTKIDIRPEITSTLKSENQSQEEIFQNEKIRPVLKLQHDLIHSFFKSHISSKKIKFELLSAIQKQETIDNLFSKDHKFKAELRGLVIGLFTVEEYETFVSLQKELNKRIYTMVKQRIMSNYTELQLEI